MKSRSQSYSSEPLSRNLNFSQEKSTARFDFSGKAAVRQAGSTGEQIKVVKRLARCDDAPLPGTDLRACQDSPDNNVDQALRNNYYFYNFTALGKPTNFVIGQSGCP